MEHLKEKYYGGHDAAAEAFEELCAMVENINVSTTYDIFSIRYTLL